MIILNVVLAVVFFSVGALIGVKDCKKKFNIPKGAIGADDNGYIFS